MKPLLSVIIVNWNTCALLAECIAAVERETTSIPHDIWVVDNGSSDGSAAMLRQDFPHVQVIESPVNLGFARANNLAMRRSAGRYLLLLNTDALVQPGSVQALLQVAEAAPRAGVVGAHLLNPDGTFQASHTHFPTLWQEFLILSTLGRRLVRPWYPSHGPEETKGPQRVEYVEGACMLVRREALAEVGGLDEGYFMYAEEVDWCKRMRAAGWEVWYAPAAKVVHIGGASSADRKTSREADLYRSRVRYFRIHHGRLEAEILKVMIILFTAVKQVVHALTRWTIGSRYGRPVVTLRDLLSALRKV
ncbi:MULTISPECIES: glycosyltransferase family 2 protein [Caldilinea]|jgi:GT2 family glycosyltransferase|uniref:Putative glycosyltransferase n=1 Tax=Caldilinea aerophila (strain DSM 14535 / JCM 11387 / NBRC 104270 / STL-6-O1) TaxID=926550 RepID=I0I6D3_CALAS|nr:MULTISPECIES: glycosyltransferase family 2 protein [Caldilinea]MBO9394728.1 glycosyltransferase family 2 protein [Caldilinea sp.]BAM00821.1 putative glycosyltransferase [Caldilinea aerophila DSM 14535 = NBRC 104270]GIV72164.1 MAG: glycosyl transferase [Caldilinea sp.]